MRIYCTCRSVCKFFQVNFLLRSVKDLYLHNLGLDTHVLMVRDKGKKNKEDEFCCNFC